MLLQTPMHMLHFLAEDFASQSSPSSAESPDLVAVVAAAPEKDLLMFSLCAPHLECLLLGT